MRPVTPAISTWARLRALVLVGSLFLLIWIVSDLAYVTIGAEADHAAPADVILVLGCSTYGGPPGGPSPCIRARAEHAAALYREGLAAHVIASGGAEDTRTEAAVIQGVLVGAGVPAIAIVLEDRSHDTIQNIYNSRTIMRAHGWQSADLVTEPYHINRATLIARDAGLTIFPSPAVDSPAWQTASLRRRKLAEDTLSLMLYQVKALAGIRQ